MKKYKIIIDRGRCIGCGVCTSLSPDILDMADNDGLVRAKNSKPQGNLLILEIEESKLEEFQKVVASCPVQVFKIKD